MDTSEQISALKMAQQWFNQHKLPERADDVKAEHVIKAIELALAEQSARPESNLKFDGELPRTESEFITAAQARELGFGNAEWFNKLSKTWVVCSRDCGYNEFQANGDKFEYRAIKQAQPEPIDKHAELRAEYEAQVAGGTIRFYIWEYKSKAIGKYLPIKKWNEPCEPSWLQCTEYRCTDISCMVAKEGAPAVRILRAEAQELQRKLGDTVEWFDPAEIEGVVILAFDAKGTYTYRTKATIKLGGRMVTPEQAAAEWEAKKDTHDVYGIGDDGKFRFLHAPNWWAWNEVSKHQYELREKSNEAVTDIRSQVLAILKEEGLIK